MSMIPTLAWSGHGHARRNDQPLPASTAWPGRRHRAVGTQPNGLHRLTACVGRRRRSRPRVRPLRCHRPVWADPSGDDLTRSLRRTADAARGCARSARSARSRHDRRQRPRQGTPPPAEFGDRHVLHSLFCTGLQGFFRNARYDRVVPRLCRHCGAHLRECGVTRPQAKFCSARCRVAAHRAAGYVSPPREPALPREGTCVTCGKTFFQSGRGRTRMSCGSQCAKAKRQADSRAFHERRKARLSRV
jgi:hypothetical protein